MQTVYSSCLFATGAWCTMNNCLSLNIDGSGLRTLYNGIFGRPFYPAGKFIGKNLLLSLADPVLGIDKPIIIRFADGKVKAGPDAVSTVPTLFVESNKTYLDILNRIILLHNAPDSFSAGRLRVIAATHIF